MGGIQVVLGIVLPIAFAVSFCINLDSWEPVDPLHRIRLKSALHHRGHLPRDAEGCVSHHRYFHRVSRSPPGMVTRTSFIKGFFSEIQGPAPKT